MAREIRSLEAGVDDSGKRLDRVVRTLLPGTGLGALFGAIRRGEIRVNGKRRKLGYRISAGDRIEIPVLFFPAPAEEGNSSGRPADVSPKSGRASLREKAGLEGETSSASLVSIPPLVIYEDADFLVLNKPRGLLVHGEGSLDEAVKNHLSALLPPSLAFSPGCLHRLDRNTTGVLFFSKSLAGARFFSEALRKGKTRKLYLALAEGEVGGPESWCDDLVRDGEARVTRVTGGETASSVPAVGGPAGYGRNRSSFTEVWPLASAKGYTLLRVALRTGRTHQIRAQAAARGHPLAGDVKYGGRPFSGGYLLHAAEFTLLEGNEPPYNPVLTVKAPPPKAFTEKAAVLFGKSNLTF